MKHRSRTFVSQTLTVAAVLVLTIGAAAWAQTESVIHSFAGGNDGYSPESGIMIGPKGNLFGTTSNGGQSSTCAGCGTVFELSPGSNGTWTETIIYAFSGNDGAAPYSPLLLDRQGNLYGTTLSGGNTFGGTVFELSPGSGGAWTEKVLYSFTGGADGSLPFGGGLAMDSAGNLYGTTELGGQYGFGTVFELVPGTNGTWTEKVLHSFKQGNDGANPIGDSLAVDAGGNIYGMAASGGRHDYGVVYKLTPTTTGAWNYSEIYSFPGGSGGSSPTSNLVFDSAGNLYGSALFIVFELTPNTNGTWIEKTLHTFGGGSDGSTVQGGLVFDHAGNLYGTTYAGGFHRGTVFKLSPDSNGTWSETVLHRFKPQGGDGEFPVYGDLAIDTHGRLFGTTPQGGASNLGAVFEVEP